MKVAFDKGFMKCVSKRAKLVLGAKDRKVWSARAQQIYPEIRNWMIKSLKN